MRLKGQSFRAIAAELEIAESTVRHHLGCAISPAWREAAQEKREELLAKVDLLERVAWEKFDARSEPPWLETVKWCLNFRARVFGSFAPKKLAVDVGGEFRVEGLSPAQVDQAMLARLAAKIAERRRYEAALKVEGSQKKERPADKETRRQESAN